VRRDEALPSIAPATAGRDGAHTDPDHSAPPTLPKTRRGVPTVSVISRFSAALAPLALALTIAGTAGSAAAAPATIDHKTGPVFPLAATAAAQELGRWEAGAAVGRLPGACQPRCWRMSAGAEGRMPDLIDLPNAPWPVVLVPSEPQRSPEPDQEPRPRLSTP
jgi:hypothetical protein